MPEHAPARVPATIDGAAPPGSTRQPPGFRPAWWLPSPHLQTLWAALARRPPRLPLRRERIELPDGDFVDLDWAAGPREAMVLVLHGLEGSSRARYSLGMMQAVLERGWGAATLNFRGCSGEHNRLDRSYHSGETGDLDHVVGLLRARHPGLRIAVVGFSLGGNALLKWLGERGGECPVVAAAAVSVPLLLDRAAERMASGFSRVKTATPE